MVDHSVGKDLPSIFVESFEYFPGRGLTATVNGVEVRHSYVLESIDSHFPSSSYSVCVYMYISVSHSHFNFLALL